MAKTNFDKWKEELKPEDIVDMLLQDWDLIDKIRRDWAATNSEQFLAWANAEAEDDNDDGDEFIKWNKHKEKGL